MNAQRYLPAISFLAAMLMAFGSTNGAHAVRLAGRAPFALSSSGPGSPISPSRPVELKAVAVPLRGNFPVSRNYATKIATVLKLEPLGMTAIGDLPVVVVHLTTDYGAPIKNEPIQVFAYKNRVAQGLTDSSGTARIQLHFDFYPGDYPLVVAFDGSDSDGLSPSDAYTVLTVVPGTLQVRTVPAMAGVQFRFNNQTLTTDSDGLVQFTVDHIGTYHIEVLPVAQSGDSARIEFDRWNNNDVSKYHEFKFPVHRALEAGFLIAYPVNLRYTDKGNRPVDPARISFTRVRTAGTFYSLKDPSHAWLPTNYILHRVGGFLESKQANYYLDSVTIAGANVVNQGQQRYLVTPNSTWWIQLYLYSARFSAHDALLGFPVGSGILLEYPDGARRQVAFDPTSPVVKLDALPRGIYHASVQGAQGLEPRIPLSLSREREFDLIVLSRIDLAILLGVPALLALLFLVMGRTNLLTWLSRLRRRYVGLASIAMLGCIFLLSSCSPAKPSPSMPPTPSAPPSPTASMGDASSIPILAYYYIWFDNTSWDKNKVDYPLLGHYSSGDPAIMRQHIEWAKSAGITGFIVSWKSTDRLNPRLDQLIQIARDENFKLAINYQGLDQQRNPIPASQVAADLDYFIAHYSKEPVFDIYGKPLVIWAGTWKFSPADISGVTQGRRDQLLILASDRDVPGIQRLNGMVDGDAYYFSSVNPDTYPNYQGKLNDMAQAVHSGGGLWIAPAAPGFDARMIGGTTVVDRKDGQTLRIEFTVASQSSPDAIGLISWNEFTENSHIEPSVNYGRRYLDLLATIDNVPVPQVNSMDSSDPGSGPQVFPEEALALGLIASTVVVSTVVIARRH